MIDILDSSFQFWVNETDDTTCAILYRQNKKWKTHDCLVPTPYMCQTGRSVYYGCLLEFLLNGAELSLNSGNSVNSENLINH